MIILQDSNCICAIIPIADKLTLNDKNNVYALRLLIMYSRRSKADSYAI